MPKADGAKTKSARKIIAVGAGIIVLGLVTVLFQRGNTQPDCAVALTARGRTKCVALERADTEAERAQGLSGRSSLPDNQGMLFVFDGTNQQCMWMKDMRFSIDLVWLDAQGTISKIETNVSPATYPATFCSDNTAYVIELNARVAEKANLRLGQRLTP
jgi:uncharacterized membrane protein (UPF0127 family)